MKAKDSRKHLSFTNENAISWEHQQKESVTRLGIHNDFLFANIYPFKIAEDDSNQIKQFLLFVLQMKALLNNIVLKWESHSNNYHTPTKYLLPSF